jgi:hypothetical protein
MKYFLLLTLGLLPFISKAQVSELFGGRFIFTQDTLITGSEDLYVVGIFKHPRTNFHVDSIQAGDILVDCDCNVFTVDTFYSSTGSIATLRVTPQDTSVNDIRSCTGGIMRAHSPPHDAFYHFPANIPLEIQDCFLNYNLSRLIEYEFGDGLTLTGDVVDLGGTYDSEILINSAGSDSFNITTNGMVELDVNGLRVHNGSTKGTIFFDEYSNTSWYIDALNGLSLHTSGATSADINFYRSGTKFAEASELQGLRIDRLTSWTETSGYVFNIHGYDVDTGDGGSIIMRGGQSSATNADGGYLKFYGGQVDTMYSGGFGGNPGYISFYTITDSNDSTTYGTYMPAIHMPGGTYAGNVSLSGAHNPTASVDIDGNLRTRGNPTTVEAYVLMSDARWLSDYGRHCDLLCPSWCRRWI